jgi:hypothetical protein
MDLDLGFRFQVACHGLQLVHKFGVSTPGRTFSDVHCHAQVDGHKYQEDLFRSMLLIQKCGVSTVETAFTRAQLMDQVTGDRFLEV